MPGPGFITLGENKTSLRLGSTPFTIYRFLCDTYPAFFTPKDIHRETGRSYASVKKAVVYLHKQGLIEKPYRNGRGYYRGLLNGDNLNNIERPKILFHNIKIKVEVPQRGVHHPPLYTQGRKVLAQVEGEKPEQMVFFVDLNGVILKTVIQFYVNCVLCHVNSSKTPLDQDNLFLLKERLMGVLLGLGVNVDFGLKIVSLEMSKDYEKVILTPKMVSIQDLVSGDVLRFYQKTRSLSRLEIVTSWDTEKDLYKIFRDFGGKDNRVVPGYQ